jgi:uncharacterized membrane protein YeaQ/YmgE (transglycosylase-associated protein family)
MQPEPKDEKDLTQWILICVGISVVVGTVVSQLFDFENLGKLRLISLTNQGPVADILLIVAAVLVVLGGVRMTVIMRPRSLIFLGAVILVAALAGPAMIARLSSNIKFSIPFLASTVLGLVGAILVGAGLRRLFWQDQTKT